MEEVVKGERLGQEGITRLTTADGKSEDFANVYGGLCIPHEETPGLILLGGLVHDSYIKILIEKEFRTISECVLFVNKFKSLYQVYRLYHREGAEDEAFAASLQNRISFLSIESAKHTANISFAIPLVRDYVGTDRLFVPRQGVLMRQLQADWASDALERTFHGVIALFCLLSGVEFVSHVFDPIDLEAGLM